MHSIILFVPIFKQRSKVSICPEGSRPSTRTLRASTYSQFLSTHITDRLLYIREKYPRELSNFFPNFQQTTKLSRDSYLVGLHYISFQSSKLEMSLSQNSFSKAASNSDSASITSTKTRTLLSSQSAIPSWSLSDGNKAISFFSQTHSRIETALPEGDQGGWVSVCKTSWCGNVIKSLTSSTLQNRRCPVCGLTMPKPTFVKRE